MVQVDASLLGTSVTVTRALWTTAVSWPAANFFYQFMTREDYALAFDRSFHQLAVIGWLAFLLWRARAAERSPTVTDEEK